MNIDRALNVIQKDYERNIFLNIRYTFQEAMLNNNTENKITYYLFNYE